MTTLRVNIKASDNGAANEEDEYLTSTIQSIDSERYPYRLPVFKLSQKNIKVADGTIKKFSKVRIKSCEFVPKFYNITYQNNKFMWLRKIELGFNEKIYKEWTSYKSKIVNPYILGNKYPEKQWNLCSIYINPNYYPNVEDLVNELNDKIRVSIGNLFDIKTEESDVLSNAAIKYKDVNDEKSEGVSDIIAKSEYTKIDGGMLLLADVTTTNPFLDATYMAENITFTTDSGITTTVENAVIMFENSYTMNDINIGNCVIYNTEFRENTFTIERVKNDHTKGIYESTLYRKDYGISPNRNTLDSMFMTNTDCRALIVAEGYNDFKGKMKDITIKSGFLRSLWSYGFDKGSGTPWYGGGVKISELRNFKMSVDFKLKEVIGVSRYKLVTDGKISISYYDSKDQLVMCDFNLVNKENSENFYPKNKVFDNLEYRITRASNLLCDEPFEELKSDDVKVDEDLMFEIGEPIKVDKEVDNNIKALVTIPSGTTLKVHHGLTNDSYASVITQAETTAILTIPNNSIAIISQHVIGTTGNDTVFVDEGTMRILSDEKDKLVLPKIMYGEDADGVVQKFYAGTVITVPESISMTLDIKEKTTAPIAVPVNTMMSINIPNGVEVTYPNGGLDTTNTIYNAELPEKTVVTATFPNRITNGISYNTKSDIIRMINLRGLRIGYQVENLSSDINDKTRNRFGFVFTIPPFTYNITTNYVGSKVDDSVYIPAGSAYSPSSYLDVYTNTLSCVDGTIKSGQFAAYDTSLTVTDLITVNDTDANTSKITNYTVNSNEVLLYDKYYNDMIDTYVNNKKFVELDYTYGDASKPLYKFGFKLLPVSTNRIYSQYEDFTKLHHDSERIKTYVLPNVLEYTGTEYKLTDNFFAKQNYIINKSFVNDYLYNFTLRDDLSYNMGIIPVRIDLNDYTLPNYKLNSSLDVVEHTNLLEDIVYVVQGKYYSECIYTGPIYTQKTYEFRNNTTTIPIIYDLSEKDIELTKLLDNEFVYNSFVKNNHSADNVAQLILPSKINVNMTVNKDVEHLLNSNFDLNRTSLKSYEIKSVEQLNEHIKQNIDINVNVEIPENDPIYVYLNGTRYNYSLMNNNAVLNVEYVS